MLAEVSQKEKEEIERLKMEAIANMLIRLPQNGVFYQTETMTYLIPVQCTLGYKVSPLRRN